MRRNRHPSCASLRRAAGRPGRKGLLHALYFVGYRSSIWFQARRPIALFIDVIGRPMTLADDAYGRVEKCALRSLFVLEWEPVVSKED